MAVAGARRRSPILKWIRCIWVTAGLAFTAWILWNVQAHRVPASLLESSGRVTVATADGIIEFQPTDAAPTQAGLIFLPGGGIDPHAYVPFVRAFAEAGHPSAIVRLPWRVAPTEGSRTQVWNRVLEVIASWGGRPVVLAGHSRGAALAGRFADRHRDALDGLAMIATTHPRDENLSALRFPVLKIVGSRDCVAPADDARANAGKLPAETTWVEIDGANHAQFGHYGSQFNDCGATISREAQQQQARDAVLTLLRSLDASGG